MSNKEIQQVKQNPLAAMAERLSIDPDEMQNIVMKTVMPGGGKGVTNEQFVAFVAVANNYGLDPLKKEIYAFPAKGGGIQPIVSIDGWLNIINTHHDFDGMQLEEKFIDGEIFSITCTIHKKSTAHPVVITEYLAECIRNTDSWKKKIRMLRHKSTIQCGRYAFGLSGISDQDEAEAALEEKEVKGETIRDLKPQKETVGDLDTFEDESQAPEAEQQPEQSKLSQTDFVLQEIAKCKTIQELEEVKTYAQNVKSDDLEMVQKAYSDRGWAIKENRSKESEDK